MSLSEFKNESLFKRDGGIDEEEAQYLCSLAIRRGWYKPPPKGLTTIARPPANKKKSKCKGVQCTPVNAAPSRPLVDCEDFRTDTSEFRG